MARSAFGTEYLFVDGDLREEGDRRRVAVQTDIERYERNRLLNSSVDDLVNYFAAKYAIDVPVLDESKMRAQESESHRDVSQDFNRSIMDRSRPFFVPATAITVFIPFTGDGDVLKLTPSTRYMGSTPQGEVRDADVVLRYMTTGSDAQALKQWLSQTLTLLRQYLEWSRQDALNFNNTLPSLARSQIEARRQRLLDSQGLVASLGIPLVERPDAPRTYSVPDIRPKFAQPPLASTVPFVPEPALDDTQYERILSLIRSMGRTIERDPSAFVDLDEEALRSVFLATLNSHFEGRATGETFNASGKTDILIREKDRNIFIAECKFWRGPKSLLEAVDQVLAYSTWRDSKTAIILFVKQQDFSSVLEKIPSTIAGHKNFKSGFAKGATGEFRGSLHQVSDPSRELIVTILAFHLHEATRADESAGAVS